MTKPKKRKNIKKLTNDDFKHITNPTRDIKNILNEIEYNNNIEIIYAALHGSRLYDFENDESNYNIYFIYKQNIEEYLTINNTQTKINHEEDNYIFKGIDIKQALQLHHKSDHKLYEIINSTTTYIKKYDFNNIIPLDKTQLLNQYTKLAEINFKTSRQDIPYTLKREDIKNYIYSIIYVLQWNELYEKDIITFNIHKLKKPLIEHLQEYIEAFIRTYNSGYLQIGYIELSNINSWLYNQIKIMKNTKLPKKRNLNYEYHNWKFREIIK